MISHTPGRIPSPSQEYFRVPFNQVVVASIQPAMITTSESVKKYNSGRRECFFSFERRLKYFKTYSQMNCKLECLTNETLTLCDCVNFFMPSRRVFGFLRLLNYSPFRKQSYQTLWAQKSALHERSGTQTANGQSV